MITTIIIIIIIIIMIMIMIMIIIIKKLPLCPTVLVVTLNGVLINFFLHILIDRPISKRV